MQKGDYKEFSYAIRVLGASYDAFMDDAKVQAYWVNLEREPLQTVEEVCLELTRAYRSEDTKMPNAQYIRRLCKTRMHANLYALPCQQPGCPDVVAFPPQGDVAEDSYYCPRHQPETSHPATTEERLSIVARLTAAGKAFLRGALALLMADIPVTPEEIQAGETAKALKRASTSEGPGVNAAWVKEHAMSTVPTTWMVAHRERRQAVRQAGYVWDQAESVWRKGTRVLTEEQIDTMDLSLLHDYLTTRSA